MLQLATPETRVVKMGTQKTFYHKLFPRNGRKKKKKKKGEVFVDVNTQQFNPVLVAVSY